MRRIYMKFLTLALISALPTVLFAVTTSNNLRGPDAQPITKPAADFNGYYFTLFQNAKTNVQVTATTYSKQSDSKEFSSVQCDAPVNPSPFGHTSVEYSSVDPKLGTTRFMLEDATVNPIEITKTGAGIFTICPSDDSSTTPLITPDQENNYARFCK